LRSQQAAFAELAGYSQKASLLHGSETPMIKDEVIAEDDEAA
jgi:hypothetical protein